MIDRESLSPVRAFVLILLILSLLDISPIVVFVRAQSDCTTYNQCPALLGQSGVTVQSPITYWFDNGHIDSLLSPSDASNFRDRLRAAEVDWVVKTGINISEGSSGQVRIRVSGISFYRDLNGVVEPDQNNPGGIVMTFSTEWPEWTTAGKDRLASHEWGHILGFGDVTETTCAGVETIMRQFSANSTTFDNQLRYRSASAATSSEYV